PNGVLLDVWRREGGGGAATLRITDDRGAEIRTLEAPEERGFHRVVWDLRDEDDEAVEPGRYTVTLELGSVRQSQTAVVRPPVVLPRG
ncbi:MAG TPA: FlgD immunoglobulin-like domain containing protein, partial [Longimicrobiales bacterium]|nr:FlgD immunoglobulin-like domain containing protein [Longimicrobiales bacterium]